MLALPSGDRPSMPRIGRSVSLHALKTHNTVSYNRGLTLINATSPEDPHE
jgi:hypothetical protein